MKVLKFGESTLSGAGSIELVLSEIKGFHDRGEKVIVVVSAYNQVLSKLYQIAQLAMVGDKSYVPILQDIENEHFQVVKKFIDIKRQAKVLAGLKVMLNGLEEILLGVFLLWELSPRTQDHIRSYGVKLMAYLLSECLQEAGVASSYTDAQSIIVTDNHYGEAEVLQPLTLPKIQDWYKNQQLVPVVTGYLGATIKGESTSLGRSGSSRTAALLAKALKAEELILYSDKDGIISSEKAFVSEATSLSELSYLEAMEIANFDNKAIYPPALQAVFDEAIPVTMLNLYNPDFKGTRLLPRATSKSSIKANSIIESISLLNITGSNMLGVAGVAARVFGSLAEHKINVVLITQASSEHSICLAVSPEDASTAAAVLDRTFAEEIKEKKMDKTEIIDGMSIIAVIGASMKNTPGLAGKVFSILGQQGVNITAIAQGSSELNISIVVRKSDLAIALRSLYDAFLTH